MASTVVVHWRSERLHVLTVVLPEAEAEAEDVCEPEPAADLELEIASLTTVI